MNSSAYIFGNLGGGFTQYPEDYAHEIYEEFQLKAEAPSQVIIHRDKSIMYYGYVRKLDRDGQYIGLCVLLNGVMLSKMASLFSVFEKVVSEMVSQGELIKMDENGDIIGVAERLDDKQQEVERIVTYLREEVIHWESTATKLPPISYSISNDSCRTFSITDMDEEIVEASAKYGFVCVQKNEEYDTPLLAGLRNVLKKKLGKERSVSSETGVAGKRNHGGLKILLWSIALVLVIGGLFVVSKNVARNDDLAITADTTAVDSIEPTASLNLVESMSSLDNQDIVLRGKISDIGIGMKLHFSEGEVEGAEHYDSQPAESLVYINGYMEDDGTLELYEYDQGKWTGTFSGIFSNGVYSGTWYSPSDRKISFTTQKVAQDTYFKDNRNYVWSVLLNSLLGVDLSPLDNDKVHTILINMGFDYVCESINGSYLTRDCEVTKKPAYTEQYDVETDEMKKVQIGYSCTPKNANEQSVFVETDEYRGPAYISVIIWGKSNLINWQKQLKACGYKEQIEEANMKWVYTKRGKYEITIRKESEYGQSAYSLLIWGTPL